MIKELCKIGAVSKSKKEKNDFYSNFFLVKKPNGSFRFILNLKNLNKHIDPPHFKLEDYRSVKDLLHKDYFLASIDLKDAYFLIPIHDAHQKYLKFEFEDNIYKFSCMPFGISIAPYTFTKLLKPVITYLRNLGIICVIYLDDILVLAKNKTECFKNIIITRDLLISLGFLINFDKSVLIPHYEARFLGFIFNTHRMKMYLPLEKKSNILSLSKRFLNNPCCTIRFFAQYIGTLVAACPAVKYGWGHIKIFERFKYLVLKKNNQNYNKKVCLPNYINEDIMWWINNIADSSVSLRQLTYKIEIFSDSSNYAWGAVCNNTHTGGFWNKTDQTKHINFLELKAAFFALKSFTKNVHDCNILLRIDNTTAITYINKMGGIKYRHLNKQTQKLWSYCENKNIFIYASYVNTKQNIADFESRHLEVETEYELNNKYFTNISNSFGIPSVDLFASNINKKCKTYASWKPDPGSWKIDAFSFCWKTLFFYAFPPFSIISKVLKKIIDEKCTGILVVPRWPSQPWYPIYKQLLISEPLVFGPKENLLMSPFRTPHPLCHSLILEAGLLSGSHI